MKTVIRSNYFVIMTTLLVILVITFPQYVSAQSGKVNFSGNWVLNTQKSTMTDSPRMGAGDFMAKQEGNLLTLERTLTNRDGQSVTNNMKYTFDGKESVNSTQRGESKSVASWSADGKTLTISTVRNINMGGTSRSMKSVEVWTMPDQKTINIQSTVAAPAGDRKMLLVYDRR